MSYNSAVDAETESTEDLYSFQRDELLSKLKSLMEAHAPLVVHDRATLDPDDIARVLQKIRHGYGFSRRERSALEEAGFDLDRLFPGR